MPETKAPAAKAAAPPTWERHSAPDGFWITLAVGAAVLLVFYAVFTFTRLEVFKMLLASFFPLAVLILAVWLDRINAARAQR